MSEVKDTIFALATAAGRAAVCIVRISGPSTASALCALIGKLPKPRHATLMNIRDPVSRLVLDQGLVLWFPAPHSFTGEDCAEFQLHGSRAVSVAVLRTLGYLPGLRLAEPGEFTRRAFLNARLDLAQAEGLADLIESETEQQRRQAVKQLAGHFGQKIDQWRDKLIHALALVEAEIDFVDEGDAPTNVLSTVMAITQAIKLAVAAVLSRGKAGEKLRNGLVVVIAGAPNVGKSSLLNAIAQRDVAIVSPLAGTTRDLIVLSLDIAGYPVQLIDTAGLRQTKRLVEAEGIARAKRAAEQADLVLWLVDENNTRQRCPVVGPETAIWKISSKCDVADVKAGGTGRPISSVTGVGIAALLDDIGVFASQCLGVGGEPEVTRERHRTALAEVHGALARASELGSSVGLEIVAEELRLAAAALGGITGRVDVEDILGDIFSRFCIGK